MFISLAKCPCAKVPNVQDVAKSSCILNIRFALLKSCRFSPRFFVCTVMYSSSWGSYGQVYQLLFTRGRYKQKSRSDRNVARIWLNCFDSYFLTNIVNPPVCILKFPRVLYIQCIALCFNLCFLLYSFCYLRSKRRKRWTYQRLKEEF